MIKNNKKMNNKTERINAFTTLLPIIIKASPGIFILSQLSNILHSISWGFITIMTQRFFDAAAAVSAGESLASKLYMAFIALGLAYLFSQILNGFGNLIPQIFVDRVGGVLSQSIHRKICRLSPIIFENTTALDELNKAEQGKNHAVWFILLSMAILTFYVPYFIFFAIYLLSLKPLLALGIAMIFIPTALTQLIRSRWFAHLEDKSAPIRREYAHYEDCISGRDYFKETRMLGGFYYFRNLALSNLIKLNKMDFKTHMKTNILELCMKIFTLAGYLGIILLLFDAMMKREITIGAFAAIFAAIGRLFSVMEEIVCRHLGSITQNIGTITNYIHFLRMEEHLSIQCKPPEDFDSSYPIHELKAENVSFAYPGNDIKAIDVANFTIHKGEIIAIVGENGSGKSTLVRLISGLYLPDDGSITYNGFDTREISSNAVYERISAVFQKYQRYQLTLKDNITISDMKNQITDEYLDSVATASGIRTSDKEFLEGYETVLSREFGKTDLSGGQWQRIAFARGLYRDRELIILDEPTASIDPIEETLVYERFIELAKGKTAIIVTHRLGSAKLADRIFVMQKGKIAECGTHEELMAIGGNYAGMYKTQQFWYQSKVNC